MAVIESEQRVMHAIRILPSQKEAIQQRADEAGLSWTQFVIRSALGELDDTPSAIARRLEELEARMDRLEQIGLGA